jgi:outer membrane protein assembly factor BamB
MGFLTQHTEFLLGNRIKVRIAADSSFRFLRLFIITSVLFSSVCITVENGPSVTLTSTPSAILPTIELQEEKDSQNENIIYLPMVNGVTSYLPEPGSGSWPMAGANPQRNSWTTVEVRGRLQAEWFKPFEAYIPQKVQIIAEYGNLYISTSNGLYALDAASGAEKWVYPTEMPLGHSPTVADDVVYFGGFDHKLHAVDAHSGNGLWEYAANAGFDTNPLVVDGIVYAGNRDGYFYAIHTNGPSRGQLAWKYKTDGPIHYSASYNNGVVYFASNDSRAYALDAHSGQLIWKSAKLPGAGFHSWWPVVYGDVVIFSGSNNYRSAITPGGGNLFASNELADVYPHHKQDPRGTLVGPLGSEPGAWAPGTPTIDTSQPNITSNGQTVPITEYFESKPWRRTYFVLDRSSGTEVKYDFDRDGKEEFAPILWLGTRSGNRYPPVVGVDGVIYQGNNYFSDPTIAGGQISGWKIGTPFISIAKSGWNAVDEPVAYSAGGDLIYWSRCCDRIAGAFDITIPESDFEAGQISRTFSNVDRTWNYFNYNLPELIPGYNSMTYAWEPVDSPFGGVYGGRNGSYGFHGDVNPPIPYQGKVYLHRGNSIIAFSQVTGEAKELPMAPIHPTKNAGIPALSDDQIIELLESEVSKMISAGHLRPGYASTGLFDLAGKKLCGADLIDYWHSPSDTIYTLLRALPHLSLDLRQQTEEYLQEEFNNFPPYLYEHIGWIDGAAREIFITPPEVKAEMLSAGPQKSISNFQGWKFSPYSFYALWKYAEAFGSAKEIFDLSKSQLAPVPTDSVIIEMPHVHNAFIAGYWGYLELENMAGYTESSQIRNELNRLLDLRVSAFSIGAPDSYFQGQKTVYCRNLISARNFMFLVPELAEYLREQALGKVEEAIDEYHRVTPLWFVAGIESAFAEGTINHLYDYNAIFQAEALIVKQSRDELTKYLDVPAFETGDLFYIQNLVSLLEANQIQE